MPRGLGRRRSCASVREVLSAALDGEVCPAERAEADAHLDTCVHCRTWLDDAAAVTRLARAGPAVAGPDVTAAVLPAAPGRRRTRLVTGLRVALAGIGVAQLLLTVAQMVAQMSLTSANDRHVHGGVLGDAGVGHLGNESAAWSIGLAVGFLWVAARRGRPAAMLPVLTAFIGIVVLLNAGDLASGVVDIQHVVAHGTEVVGFLIVLALSWPPLTARLTPPALPTSGAGPAPAAAAGGRVAG